jgi:hypothetical protein
MFQFKPEVQRNAGGWLVTLGVCLTLMTAPSALWAQNEELIHAFNGSKDWLPGGVSGVISDTAGNLYGTTSGGGNPECDGGCGRVFQLTRRAGGGFTAVILHDFRPDGIDGVNPMAGLAIDAAGNLYGSTQSGGPLNYDCGIIFELQPGANGKWEETVLHAFKGSDGCYPVSSMVFDASGNLYGTAGMVFKLSRDEGGRWKERVLHRFNKNEGEISGLILDGGGNLYGAVEAGGNDGFGEVFKLTPQPDGEWTKNVLHSFHDTQTDGGYPYGPLVFDVAGNLYGTTLWGGASLGDCFREYGCGTVFQLTPSANGRWAEKLLHSFGKNSGDGLYPNGGLVFDAAGNLYGTTEVGGVSAPCQNFGWGTDGCGIVFQLVPGKNNAWTENVIYNFCADSTCGDGAIPDSGLISDTKGNLYGSTLDGGNLDDCGHFGCGTVFEITPARSTAPVK